MQWLELIGGLVVAAALVLGAMRYFHVTARNAAARNAQSDEALNTWAARAKRWDDSAKRWDDAMSSWESDMKRYTLADTEKQENDANATK